MKALFASVCVLLTVWAIAAPGGEIWEVRLVHPGQGWGYGCSLGLDSADQPHVAHYNSNRTGGTLHTQWDGTNWVSTTVHPKGLKPDLVMGTGDTAHISFTVRDWDSSDYGVRLATSGPGGLQVDTVNTTNAECTTSLDLDSSGEAHIGFYSSSSGGLWYSRKVGGVWTTTGLDGDAAGQLDFTLSNSGDPCAFYSAEWPVIMKFGRLVGTSWNTTLLPIPSASGLSLVFDAADDPHLSYGISASTQHAYFHGGTWHTNDIEAVFGADSSLAIDSSGTLHVTYYVDDWQVSGDGIIKHAWWSGGAWSSEVVAAGPTIGGQTSLALGSDNRPRVAFSGTEGLYVASLVLDTDDDGLPDYWEDKYGFNKDVGGEQGIDSDGDLLLNLDEFLNLTDPRVGDSDGDNFNDKVEVDAGTDPLDPLHYPATGWTRVPVADSAPEDPLVTSLSLSNSTPLMAYVGADSNVTVAAGPAWTAEPVATTSLAGPFSLDLAVADTGQTHIVYGHEGNLYYAARNGTWSAPEPLVSGNGEGDAAVALDSAGTPHALWLAYWDWPSSIHLQWRESGGTWTGTLFTAEHAVGPALAFNGVDQPVVSYGYDDGVSWGLRLNTWTGSGWQVETVYSNYVGGTALAPDASGKIHIAFLRGFMVDALMHTTYNSTNGTWDAQVVDETPVFEFALALDAAGIPHLSYRSNVRKELRYARWNPAGTNWVIQVVDSIGNTGYGNDIVVDAGGGVHISYVDKTSGKVMYAHLPSGTVDSDGDGLPDSVETNTRTYNGPTDTGTDPNNPDTDGDGNDDYQEVYHLGTNPNDADSNLQPQFPSWPSPTGVVLQWHAVTGKTYQVMHSGDLSVGFSPLSGLLMATPPMNTYTDTLQRTGANCYGISVILTP